MTQIRTQKTPFALCIAAMLTTAAPAFAATDDDALSRRLDALSQQVDGLKAEVEKLKSENAELTAKKEAPQAQAQQPVADAASANAVGKPDPHLGVVATVPSQLDHVSIFGYGEITYNRYDHDASRSEANLERGVFGIGYRFNEDTRFVSEFEVERAVASEDDVGEFEIEQFYIDHRLTDWASVKAGLILIPSGITNEVHEPPRFFGVERNFVETAIIPSTEREGGIALHGNVFEGFVYDVGVTTSFNLSKWDFAAPTSPTVPSDGRASPLGSIHQELSEARAADFAEYGSLNYNGYPGLSVGGSIFTGAVGQSQGVGVPADSRFTLLEGHVHYVHGPLQLQSVYAHGGFSDTAGLNLANAGAPTPIPKSFYGYYFQGAYRIWKRGDYSVVPYARYERFNTADSYAGEPSGFGIARQPTETVLTYGASFYLTPDLVFKTDYQHFDAVKEDDRFNLGLGFQFY